MKKYIVKMADGNAAFYTRKQARAYARRVKGVKKIRIYK